MLLNHYYIYQHKGILQFIYYLILKSYLSDCYSYLRIGCFLSPVWLAGAGVSQGAIISPFHYSLHTADISQQLSTHLASFTDDEAILASSHIPSWSLFIPSWTLFSHLTRNPPTRLKQGEVNRRCKLRIWLLETPIRHSVLRSLQIYNSILSGRAAENFQAPKRFQITFTYTLVNPKF